MNTPPRITTDIATRVMPQSTEAEIAIIASILINPTESLDRCLELLSPEHFYQRGHQIIFSTICSMCSKGEAVDTVTLSTRLKDIGKLEEVGGAYYLSKLAVAFPTAAHLEFYVSILREKYQLRRLIEVSTLAIHAAYDSQDEAEGVLDQAEAHILEIREADAQQGARAIKEVTDRMVFEIREIQEGRGKMAGLSWGFRDLNKLTFGLRPSEMVVVAARPGVGKTSLALNVAERLVLDENIPVAIFSLEMTAQQLALRMACSRARINMSRLIQGGVSEKEIQDFSRAAGVIGNSSLFVFDTAQASIGQVRASARRLKNRENIQLVIIDYLQLMTGGAMGRNDNREREVAMISSGIKALAKELEIPVLVLCQLNRQMEMGTGRKPRLSDLRESGAIEQDADIVCLMANQKAYDDDDGESYHDNMREPQKAIPVDLVIAKNRNGPVGDIRLTFFPEHTRFEDHAEVCES